MKTSRRQTAGAGNENATRNHCKHPHTDLFAGIKKDTREFIGGLRR